jgi:hypothetical protein
MDKSQEGDKKFFSNEKEVDQKSGINGYLSPIWWKNFIHLFC